MSTFAELRKLQICSWKRALSCSDRFTFRGCTGKCEGVTVHPNSLLLFGWERVVANLHGLQNDATHGVVLSVPFRL